ncbi:restin homolog isoform X3 [Ischnura elegans]|nr:restin homolog isoform X3 [Ischnura elegans]XP_046390553.1 restin homolog isoform X3 [Ischnura elegans]
MNCTLLCAHNDDDFEVEVFEEVEPQTENFSSNENYYGSHSSMPAEGVLIKLAYNQKNKNNCRSSRPCSKHMRSVSPCKEQSRMDHLKHHKVISAGTCNDDDRDRRSQQQIRCMKKRLKEMEETLEAEMEAKMSAISKLTALKNEHERLNSENCQLRANADCLDKVKNDAAELLREVCSLKQERSELKSLAEDQTKFINTLERKLCKLKNESMKMHQDGEHKVQRLVKEKTELSNQIQSLNATVTCMKKEMDLNATKYSDESTQLASERCKLVNEAQCMKKSLCEKEKMIHNHKEQIECLKSQLCEAKGEMERSMSKNTEVANLLNEAKDKLSKTEAALKNAQLQLCKAKKDYEKREMDLKLALEEKEKEIAALNEVNDCLKKRLSSQSPCAKKKIPGESRNEKSYHVTLNLGSVDECMGANEREQSSKDTQEAACCGNEGESQDLCALQEELERTRIALDKEKMESKKRCQIIQELQGNLKCMKESETSRLQELQNALKEKEQAERAIEMSFNQERRQNEKLLDELTELKWQERELSRQLCETNAQLAEYENSMNNGSECLEHTLMLEQMEEEVKMKTAQWQDYVERLTKERDDAVQAAKFASQNLMSSVADFQQHIALQRRVQEMLIDLLQKKDKSLHKGNKSSVSRASEKEND